MHELSLAESILQIAQAHTPPGATLLSVKLRAGPRRAIDRDAMQTCWAALAAGTPFPNARLDLLLEPWSLACESCGHTWTSDDVALTCPTCGQARQPPPAATIFR
ncbi:MAG: hydrogenase maturation nickel metallochaperone HypA [Tepidisphaeraceae bacterium]